MRQKHTYIALIICALILCAACKKKDKKEDPSTTKSTLVLQHDSYVANGTFGFQSGFVAGEAASVLFGAVDKDFQVKKVQLLFGGASGDSTLVLKIQKDSSGFPGQIVYSSSYSLPNNANNVATIDLSSNNIFLAAGNFFVTVEVTHSGLPSVAIDKDGTIDNTHNFIFVSGLGWAKASVYGIAGDWIIRAEVEK